MTVKSTALFTCLIFFALCGYSQSFEKGKFIDSLANAVKSMPDDTLKVMAYTKLYEQLMFRDPERSLEYAKKENELSKKLDFKRGIAASHLHFADYFKDRGQLDSARYYFNRSMADFKAINNTKGIMFVNHSLAAFEQYLGNFDKALEYGYENINIYNQGKKLQAGDGGAFNLIGAEYDLIAGIHIELGNYQIALNETMKALKFFEEKKDTIRKADALSKLGGIESFLENPEMALRYNKEAYAIYEDFKDLQYQAYAATSIGQNYSMLGELENANEYFNKALEIAAQIKSKQIEASSYIHLGNSFMQMKEIAKSREFLKKGLKIHEELEYPSSISNDLYELARTEMEANNHGQAIAYLNRSIDLAEQLKVKDNLSKAYALRSKARKATNNFQLALADFEKHKAINDSIFNTRKSQQIEEQRTIYQTERKEQEIVFQKNEIELLQEKQKASTLQLTLLISGIIGLLVIFSLVYYALRQKMKRNKLVREQLDKDLEFKTKELTTHAMHLAKKNEVLESLKQKAQELKASEKGQRGYQQLIQTINFDLQDSNNWENFTRYFEQVHKGFSSKVKTKFPGITTNELRLLALLKMNMSSKEIASILNISNEGVKKARYRLRKKLELNSEESLQDAVLQL